MKPQCKQTPGRICKRPINFWRDNLRVQRGQCKKMQSEQLAGRPGVVREVSLLWPRGRSWWQGAGSRRLRSVHKITISAGEAAVHRADSDSPHLLPETSNNFFSFFLHSEMNCWLLGFFCWVLLLVGILPSNLLRNAIVNWQCSQCMSVLVPGLT